MDAPKSLTLSLYKQTSLAVVAMPNGSYRLYFQDKDNYIREARFVNGV